MKIKKRHYSLSVKLNALVIAIILALSGGLTAIAYRVNSVRVDQYFKAATASAAGTVAAFVDGDWLGDFLDMIKSDEYRELRARAIEAGDEEMIADYLKKEGWYDAYTDMCATLSLYRDRLGAIYVYTVTLEEGNGFTIIDPDENLFYIATSIPVPPEFANTRMGQRIEPTLSVTEFGWLCSAYENVFNSRGELVCQVGVDIDMNEVMAERHLFLLNMIGFAAVLLLLAVAACMGLMRCMATKPLTMLSDAAVGFADSDRLLSKDDIISLPIRSRDEIGELYQVIRAMQQRILEYLDNLTRVTSEKERISAELNIATRIQADMLPRIFPPFPGRSEFDIYASMTPAKEVGGDFYDFFLIDDDHLGLVMADVSGKGVPAALFMVIAKTLIKNRAQMGGGPAEILRYVNAQLCEGNEAELFVTVWLAILEISTGKGLAANAGHEHPVIRRGDARYELVVYQHSPPVATLEDIRFREHSFELLPGDTLFVYTDGVTEATNANDELFGTDRLLTALNRDPAAEPREQLAVVKREIDDFVGDAPQFDDITMMCLHYTGPERKNMKELTIEAEIENLDKVIGFVDEQLEALECPMKAQMQIDVAVEEIFVNIASYAYVPGKGSATICVAWEEDPKTVSITFIDRGVPYDPLKKEDPDVSLPAAERAIGGLGIFMVKKSMDEMTYEYRDGQNVLCIRKRL